MCVILEWEQGCYPFNPDLFLFIKIYSRLVNKQAWERERDLENPYGRDTGGIREK